MDVAFVPFVRPGTTEGGIAEERAIREGWVEAGTAFVDRLRVVLQAGVRLGARSIVLPIGRLARSLPASAALEVATRIATALASPAPSPLWGREIMDDERRGADVGERIEVHLVCPAAPEYATWQSNMTVALASARARFTEQQKQQRPDHKAPAPPNPILDGRRAHADAGERDDHRNSSGARGVQGPSQLPMSPSPSFYAVSAVSSSSRTPQRRTRVIPPADRRRRAADRLPRTQTRRDSIN